jgi:uncharacterized protein (TIGR00369 family)
VVNQPDIGPFGRSLGFELLEWRDGHVRLEMAVQAHHLNRSGVLHGGIVSTLIDTACGYAGTWCRKPGHVRWAVTLSLTTQFIGQAGLGRLTAIGNKRGGGRKVFFATAEVLDAEGKLIGFGDATQRYRQGSEDADGIPHPALPHR